MQKKPYDSCSFLMPKISAKFQRVTPMGVPNRGGWSRLHSAILDQYLAISQKQCKTGT